MIVRNFSICIEFVFPDGTTIYINQSGLTSQLHWIFSCCQQHLKDANGTIDCFYPLMLTLGHWNGVKNYPYVSENMGKWDLLLTLDFNNNVVDGIYRYSEDGCSHASHYFMGMQEWLGVNESDLVWFEE